MAIKQKSRLYPIKIASLILYAFNLLLIMSIIGNNTFYTIYSRKSDPTFFKEIKDSVIEKLRN
jgi:hypothetical protein